MIPRLMCTQHPDTTVKITAGEEVDEALVAYTAYGCEEVMVDYEGKLTPFTQPKEIVMRALAAGVKLGEKFFITPRLPNPKLEEFDRAMLSLEAAVVANYFSLKYMDTQAVRWVVLPMVEDLDTVLLVRRMLRRKIQAYREETNLEISDIEVIPLIEDAFAQLKFEAFLAEIMRDGRVESFRLFLGKSDSAVKYGHIASALAIVWVLSRVRRAEQELGIKIHPILGMGTPPFRGAINNPALAHLEVIQYAGYHTATIQSAIRYDASFEDYIKVKDSILNACCMDARGVDDVDKLVGEAATSYKSVVAKYVNALLEVARLVPSTRDRVSWKVYGRQFVAEDRAVNMPRAIVYTSTWYAMGLPPIFLDSPFIVKLAKEDRLDGLLKSLPTLKKEWEYDSEFFDYDTAAKYIGEELIKSVREAMDYMGINPRTNGAYAALLRMPRSESNIIAMGKYRKFLG
ncbi:phosphoenolpyruvate carboxylase [Thermoproteus tenax]|uniref:Phosphoenolpyruvate carboxylase n=1 Tax=Thermoproteus tenax (strain ATCC 35583 / DSM 2078 / JCM 9277 / NBRC 100435 / Kra 1) TaxID=768679 RepID=G4RJK5_THETK|nr:phosphoenolpyruvate carboxylase [Thermoproteus tenax]CCC81750.1 phosphoenolpyruvate carboxylase 1 [Thermoproteus tenax Kra 1]